MSKKDGDIIEQEKQQENLLHMLMLIFVPYIATILCIALPWWWFWGHFNLFGEQGFHGDFASFIDACKFPAIYIAPIVTLISVIIIKRFRLALIVVILWGIIVVIALTASISNRMIKYGLKTDPPEKIAERQIQRTNKEYDPASTDPRKYVDYAWVNLNNYGKVSTMNGTKQKKTINI